MWSSREDRSRRWSSPLLALAIGLATLSGCAAGHAVRVPVRSAVGPGEAVRSTQADVRIATLNVWAVAVGPFDVADDVDARLQALARRLGANTDDVDVVLLQEVWKDDARQSLLSHPGVAAEFPFQVDAVAATGGSGLVVLSRFPIESATFHPFEEAGSAWKFWEGDALSGKGVLATRVRVGARTLQVANTHLIACYPRRGEPETSCDQGDPNGSTRASQLAELIDFLETYAGDAPIVAGGDFNFTRTSRLYQEIRAFGVDRGMAALRWIDIGEPNADPNRLDYIWTRPGTRVEWKPLAFVERIWPEPVKLPDGTHVPLSDHPALMARLCLVDVSDDGTHCLSDVATAR